MYLMSQFNCSIIMYDQEKKVLILRNRLAYNFAQYLISIPKKAEEPNSPLGDNTMVLYLLLTIQ